MKKKKEFERTPFFYVIPAVEVVRFVCLKHSKRCAIRTVCTHTSLTDKDICFLTWGVWGIIHWYKAIYINCPRKYGMLFCFRNAAFMVHFGNKMNKQDLINIT